jgi:inosine/xanthosine triphosphatase
MLYRPHGENPADQEGDNKGMNQGSAMRVVVGSTNPVKIAATQSVLCRVHGSDISVEAVAVESSVAHQPWGNEGTALGALNRALAAQRQLGATLGIGFEGGLLEVWGDLYTCAWCAVARDDGLVGIAGGESVLLPPSVADAVRAGAELGPAMDALTGQQDTKQHDGAIGILTGGLLNRQAAYEHLLTMALARLMTPAYYGLNVT